MRQRRGDSVGRAGRDSAEAQPNSSREDRRPSVGSTLVAKRPDPSEREQRRIARDYEARQALHAHQLARRRRDNWIGVIASALVVALAIFGVWAYSAIGPGQTVPTPDASATPTPGATDAPTPDPTETDVPAATGSNVGAPDPSLAEARTWTGTLTLNDIALGIELDGALAPQAVSGIIQDAGSGYYVGKSCHRLADSSGFQLLQCGSLDGTGAGDPAFSYGPIENAPADDVYPAGTIAMARAGGDAYSNGHQFFVVTADTYIPSDDAGGYSVVGRVTSGLEQLVAEVVDAGVSDGGTDGAPAVPVAITALTIE